MIGTHQVLVYPDPADDPAGTSVDISCLVDQVAIVHGRTDTQGQPDAAAATIDLTVSPADPLPPAVEIGAWVLVTTTLAGVAHVRFRGRVTDLSIGWDDAGEATPEAGVGQVIAVSPLADYARRIIGDEPWPAELDGARVARIFDLAGVALDPVTSDPGWADVIGRDVDRQPALELARDTADSAGGLVWHTRDGDVRYADAEHRRGHTVPDLDLDACDVLVTPTWSRNLNGLVNDVTIAYGVAPETGDQPSVHAVNDPSRDRFGRFEYSATVELAERPDAQQAANEIVTMNGFPVWMLAALPVDVAELTTAETATLLEMELHGLIRVGGFPYTGQTPTSVVAWVEGWSETLAWGVHDLALVVSDYCRTSPPPRWNDVAPTQTWNTTDPSLTWDSVQCVGPIPNRGTWDTVPASTRWDQVPATVTWDTATGIGGGTGAALAA